MPKYKKIDISEKELEDLIRQHPEHLEEGLIYIDHQKRTDRGPLDMLFVDSGKSLVVAELKVVEDDGMLMQGIDYFDYLANNLEGICRAYKDFEVDPKQGIRLLLIAPTFPVSLINRCKWVDLNLSLSTYTCIQLIETNEKLLTFSDVKIPKLPQRVDDYKFEDRINYITDLEVRKIALKFIEEVKSLDKAKIIVEPTKYSLSMKFNGKVFSYFEPRRKSFLIYTFNDERKLIANPVNEKEDIKPIIELISVTISK